MITKAQSQQRQQVILKAEEVEGGDCITETHGVQCPLEMCVFRQVWEASRPMIMCATPLKKMASCVEKKEPRKVATVDFINLTS